eukprot:16437913-Heterocapsa_arctica.AAC.1
MHGDSPAGSPGDGNVIDSAVAELSHEYLDTRILEGDPTWADTSRVLRNAEGIDRLVAGSASISRLVDAVWGPGRLKLPDVWGMPD